MGGGGGGGEREKLLILGQQLLCLIHHHTHFSGKYLSFLGYLYPDKVGNNCDFVFISLLLSFLQIMTLLI